MFGKRGNSKKISKERPVKAAGPAATNYEEFRAHPRRPVHDMKIFLDGERVDVLDYSEGGIRVRSRQPLARVPVVEVYVQDRLIRSVVAVRAWARNNETGYMFRSKQKVDSTSDDTRKVGDRAPLEKTAGGGVSGSALRNRLNL